jgi:hypothetical protein
MQDSADSRIDADRIAGTCLGIAAAASVLAMSHHPTGPHGGDGGGDFVHGAMIILLAVMAFGFFHFALRRGVSRPVILAGAVAYGIGLVANFGAATINGFVVPALAARGPDAVGHDTFLLAWYANQALARLAVYAVGAAYVLWSIDFLRRDGLVNRAIGATGVIVGAVPATLLLSGNASMELRVAFPVYSAHAVWAILVATQLVRRKI